MKSRQRTQIVVTLLIAFFLFGALPLVQAARQNAHAPAISSPSFQPVKPFQLPGGKLAFRTFSDRTGLPQNSVSAITMDQQGYLWVGTQEGTAYYNGRAWVTVSLPPQARSNWVRALYSSSDGSIWIGTNDGGVLRRDQHHWEVFDTRSGALPNDQVRCLLETQAPDGTPVMWVGTREGIACRVHQTWEKIDTVGGKLPSNLVLSLLETKSPQGTSTIWVGTAGGGLTRFQQGQWKTYTTASGLPSNVVWNLLETVTDGAATLWIGTEEGVATLRQEKIQTFTNREGLPSNNVRSLCRTKSHTGQETIWAGTDGGLARFSNNRWTSLTTRTGLPNDLVLSLFATRDDSLDATLWVGTNGGGLAMLQPGQWETFDTSNGLPDNVVSCLLELHQTGEPALAIGTDQGLARFHNQQWTTDTIQSGLPDNVVYCLAESTGPRGAPALWVGTNNGLACLEGSRWTVFHQGASPLPHETIWNLLDTVTVEGKHVLWIGTAAGGLARYEQGTWTVFNTGTGLPNNQVTCLVETVSEHGHRTLWVGTEGGGIAALQQGQWKTYNSHAGLPSDVVWGLRQITGPTGQALLWAAISNSGIAQFDLGAPQKGWVMLDESVNRKLPNRTVQHIRQTADGRIYLFTNHGIARLTSRQPTPEDPALYQVRTFTVEDGLPSNECNFGASLIDRQGRIWAGTVAGAACLDPREEEPDTHPKQLHFERVLINGAEAPQPKQAFLKPDGLAYNENNFIFEYALASFSHESETRYRTQLVGLDQGPSEWSAYFKKEYTSLPAGSYTFRLWAKDAWGNISGPKELTFTIRPAPWQTWWAYALYLLAGVGLLYGTGRWRVEALRQRARMLEAKVAERTFELDRKNEELASNIEQLRLAKAEAESKNHQLDRKNEELAENLTRLRQAKNEVERNHEELAKKNQELVASHKQAQLIFSALADVLPGTVLDRKYRLDEKIGAGGFGAVYQGTHLGLGRKVAIKVFRPLPGNDTIENLERFRLEGISACRIQHPNAVQVLDSGVTPEGIAYLVMELLHGQALSDILETVPVLSLKRCAEIIIPVCNVLAEAHRRGLIHRDIKPENIFLHQSETGEVIKVVDFGIAKFLGEQTATGAGNLTEAGTLVGTPIYMAPERLGCNPYDGKSDVYSVGVMLYEMLCGRQPFQLTKEGVLALAIQHMTQPPPRLRRFNPDIPEDVEAVVLSALEKKPYMRPQAHELAQELAVVFNRHIDEAFDLTMLVSSEHIRVATTPTLNESLPGSLAPATVPLLGSATNSAGPKETENKTVARTNPHLQSVRTFPSNTPTQAFNPEDDSP
ncbi:MAG: protein kinase [Blastocatellia bacterium]|nr:protein kinase [Blastocatellia bacterium]